MRFEGTLKTWNDDRGFGFIEPAQGGQEIFVHVRAFGPRVRRPQVRQLLSFEIEPGPQGRKRAKNVELVRGVAAPSKARHESPAQWGPAALLAIPGFAVLFVAVAILWKPPLVLAAAYLAASLVAFMAYAIDKSAASVVPGEHRKARCTCWQWLAAGLAPCWLSNSCVTSPRRRSFAQSSGARSSSTSLASLRSARQSGDHCGRRSDTQCFHRGGANLSLA